MQLLSLTTILTLGSLACATASSSDQTADGPSLLDTRGSPKYIRACTANQRQCSKIESTGKCQSATGNGLPLLFLDKGLKCNIWLQKECPRKSKNVVQGVEVAFNTKVNLSAKSAGITTVGSFKCHS